MSDQWRPPAQAHPAPTDLPLADLGSRFLAALLDRVLFYVPLAPAVAVAMAFEENGQLPDDPPPAVIVVSLLGLMGMLGVAVWQWHGIATVGQTPGKRALGIRIVRMDGGPVDFVTGVILRNWLVGFASGLANQCCLGILVTLVDVLPAFGTDRRCIHDHIAGTQVVVAVDGA